MSMEKMSGLKSTLAVSALTLSGLFMQANDVQAQCVPDKYESKTLGDLQKEVSQKSYRGMGFLLETDNQDTVKAFKDAAEKLCEAGLPIKFFFNFPAKTFGQTDHIYMYEDTTSVGYPYMEYSNMNMKNGNTYGAVIGFEEESKRMNEKELKFLPPEPTANAGPGGPG